MNLSPHDLEAAAEAAHDAYERAARASGWQTNPASRVPWDEVPAANRAATVAAVQAALEYVTTHTAHAATIADGRAYVQRHAVDPAGTVCPCCSRTVRMYRYRVSRSQAQFLVAMARASARETAYRDARAWIDLRLVGGHFGAGMRLGGKYAKLRHWGLLEAHPDQRATWRLTARAVEWMAGRALIPRYVYLLDNVLQGYDDDLVAFDQALGVAFDLADAMRAPEGLRTA